MGLRDRVAGAARSLFGADGPVQPAPRAHKPNSMDLKVAEAVRLSRDEIGPNLREVVHGRTSRITPAFQRWVEAEWLGPHTPSHVPIYQLKLMRDDPQFSLGLAGYRGPFFGVEYFCGGGSPATRAFLQRALLERPLFHRLLETCLMMLDYGFQAHELLWDRQLVEFDEDASGPKPKQSLLAYVIREANDLDPERVEILVDARDRFAGYRIDGKAVVPSEKALHAVLELEHRNWLGRSLLKRSYNPWYWCNFLYAFMNRYLERKADPPYKGRAPVDPRFEADQARSGQSLLKNPLKVLRDLLLDLRGSGNAVLPAEFDEQTKQPLWDIEVMQDSGRVDQFLPAIEHYQALKLRGIWIPERIATMDGAVGSYAASEVNLGVFFDALERVKDTLLALINLRVVEPLIRFNFGASAPMPVVMAPDFARDHKVLLGELFKAAISVPQELPDGRTYTGGQLPDMEKICQVLGVPYKKATEVASAKALPAPVTPGAPAPSSSGPPGSSEPKLPAPASLSRTIDVPITVNVPAPIIRNEIRVPRQPAPTVNVAAPTVHVAAPSVTVEAPSVSVSPQVTVAPPPREIDGEFEYDKFGNLQGFKVS